METNWFLEDMKNWFLENPMNEEEVKSQSTFHRRIPPCMSNETRKALSDSMKRFYNGKGLPDEWKANVSKSLKGRKFSEEHLRRKSEAQKRKVMINGIIYSSGREAAKALNISPACIVKWTKNGKADYIE